MCDRFIKAFTGGECQRGSVLFSADPKREDAVKDATQALRLATEDRLKLVVALDSSDDECDDDEDDDDNDKAEDSMEVEDDVTGKL